MVALVSRMLTDLIQINDTLPFNADKLTRFHSRSAPGISVYDYLVRICRFCPVENAILLSVVYFIDLLSKRYPDFVVNSLTVHRFLITAVMAGSKGLCDSFCTNSHYARVGGIPRVELNLLEVEFLTRVEYRIVPQPELLDQYYASMVARTAGGYVFAEPSSVPPSLGTTPVETPPPARISVASPPSGASASSASEGERDTPHHHKSRFRRARKSMGDAGHTGHHGGSRVRDAIKDALTKFVTPSEASLDEHRQRMSALKRRETSEPTAEEQHERADPKTPTTPKRPKAIL